MEQSGNPSGVTELPLLHESTQNTSEAEASGSRQPKATVNLAASDLKFVTISHPDDIRRRKDVRTDIRRHVMKKIGQQRRRPKTQAAQGRASWAPSPAPISPVAQQAMPASGNADTSTAPGNLCTTLPILWDLPIEPNDRAIELIRFLNEQSSVYLPFRAIWFDIALTDKGAFLMTLGNAADLMLRVKAGADPDRNPEMLQYYSLSVAHLRERLGSAGDNTSDGMVAHILSHLCLCMRRQDWTAWKAHMDGLAVISRLRDGLTNQSRGVHTWILFSDLGGSIVHDTIPRLPLPSYLRPAGRTSPQNLPMRLRQFLARLDPNSMAAKQTSHALQEVFVVANEVNTNGHSPHFWLQAEYGLGLLGSRIHFLLSMPRLSEDTYLTLQSDELIMEMTRLISLWLMSKLKTMFSFDAPEQAQLERKFSEFTTSYAGYLGGVYRDLKSWALVTASLLQNGGGRDVYLDEIRRDMATLGQTDATIYLQVAHDFIWFEALGKSGAEQLAQDITLCSDGPA